MITSNHDQFPTTREPAQMSDPKEQELVLGAETIKDLDVDEGFADTLRGGNSAGATRPGTTH
ncbi:MAG: hypothetical protein ACTHMY_01990 [Solirubrobacteraceae bacterium]